MNESDFEKIVKGASSREVWEIPEQAYKGDDCVKQVRLQTL